MKKNSGQTLVVLLVFMIVAITVISAAVIVTIVNAQNTSKLSLGENAFAIAESGVENALMRLLRDPDYTGETLPVGTGTAIINVTSNNGTRVIEATGVSGGFQRKIEVVTSYTNNVMAITSWKEK